MRSLTLSCRLAADADEVWAAALTEEGIRDEMRPVLRMRMPAGVRGRRLDEVAVGQRLGRAWLFVLGVVPVDYDDLRLESVGPGRRFQEDSRMLLLDPWRHHRRVEPVPGGCEVVDELAFAARLRALEPVAAVIVRAFFAHRHRRLVRRWGAPTQ